MYNWLAMWVINRFLWTTPEYFGVPNLHFHLAFMQPPEDKMDKSRKEIKAKKKEEASSQNAAGVLSHAKMSHTNSNGNERTSEEEQSKML